MTSSTALGPGNLCHPSHSMTLGTRGSHAGKGFTLSAPKDLYLNKPPSSVAGWGVVEGSSGILKVVEDK